METIVGTSDQPQFLSPSSDTSRLSFRTRPSHCIYLCLIHRRDAGDMQLSKLIAIDFHMLVYGWLKRDHQRRQEGMLF